LTALLSAVKSEKPKDVEFSWWTKNYPTQNGVVTDVYTDEALSSAYSAGVNAVGKELYIKMAEALAQEFKITQVVELQNPDDHSDNIGCDVIGIHLNGASSYLHVKTLEATTATTADPAACTRIAGIGNATRELATSPDPVSYNPVKYYNYAQNFWTTYSISGTMEEVELVTGDPLVEEKREKYLQHMTDIEKAFWFGRRLETYENGTRKWYTLGIIPMIRSWAPGNVATYTLETATAYKGKAWTVAGKDWLDANLKAAFTYGSERKVAWCGIGAKAGLTALAETYGTINIQPRQTVFGMNIGEWETPYGTILLKTNPQLTLSVTYANTMVLMELENIRERPLRQTRTLRDTDYGNGGFNAVDGRKEGWLTQTGLEFHHPDTFYMLNGVGVDNSLT